MVDLVKTIFLSLLLSALVYPGIERLYLYKQTNYLEDLVMAPLGFLGENQTILVNSDKFTRYGTSYKSLDLLMTRDVYIGIKNEFLPHAKWVNLSEERERVFKEKLISFYSTYKKLKNKEYSLVLFGPETYELDLRNIITEANSNPLLDDYCEIFLPSAEHKCTDCKSLVRVFFRNESDCINSIPSIIKYYEDNFYKVCRLDQNVANGYIKTAMGGVAYYLKDKCSGGGKLLIKFNDKKFRIDDFLNILYISLLVSSLFYLHIKKYKKAFIIISIILLLFLPLINFDESYNPDYYKNETMRAEKRISRDFSNYSTQEYNATFNKPAEIVYWKRILVIPPYGDSVRA